MLPEFESAVPENPGAPGARRAIADAVDCAVAELDPDQIILFGSGARGEMTEHSDVDLLVIRDAGPFGQRRGLGGGRVDIVLVGRASAEERRLTLADVCQYALEDGRTLYVRDGFDPLRTGDPMTLVGGGMAADPVYNTRKALEFLEKAANQWRLASHLRGVGDEAFAAEGACAALHRCMELSLKSLQLSFGKKVKPVHDLVQLSKAVNLLSGGKAVDLDPAVMKGLEWFVGTDFYDVGSVRRPDPARLRDEAAGPVESVLKYAQSVVPGRVQRQQAKMAAMRQRGASGPDGG